MIGYHFATPTLRDGRPLPRKGDTLTHKGMVIPCQSGLHASERALDALLYAPGPMVARVELRGTVKPHGSPVDKHVASERHYLADYANASRILREFACWCATQALDAEEAAGRPVDPRSRNAVTVALAWLDDKATGTERSAAWSAARSAAWSAARSAAESAAWSAARSAAWSAAWSAAESAAESAARSAAESAAESTAESAQNAELERRLAVLWEPKP